MPGLPCAQKVEEKEGGKKKEKKSSEANTIPNSHCLNITLILAGGLLLFCFVLMSRSTIKKHMGRDCMVC